MLLYAVKFVIVCKVWCSGCQLLICQHLLRTYAWHGTPNKLYNFTQVFVVLLSFSKALKYQKSNMF